ncbi:uncharacterized protein RSE6_11782 [Rhynchosporium secalis]|uniref:Uncharacterized protein n=1 Tax=Rhynchosporium secalis TaxID=38038 RepID=A0A1E1MNT5_RHYSE|nr:uncharacterized protein RSE6_11782 [Rhynchosporium secalis]
MPQRHKSSIEQFAAPKISTSKSKCDLNTSDQQQSTLDAVLALVGSAMASKTKENKMCSRTYPKAGKRKEKPSNSRKKIDCQSIGDITDISNRSRIHFWT